MTLRPDPPIRADGRCAQCGKPRVIPKKEPYRMHALTDPFCASPCAQRWHGVSFKQGKADGVFKHVGTPEPRAS